MDDSYHDSLPEIIDAYGPCSSLDAMSDEEIKMSDNGVDVINESRPNLFHNTYTQNNRLGRFDLDLNIFANDDAPHVESFADRIRMLGRDIGGYINASSPSSSSSNGQITISEADSISSDSSRPVQLNQHVESHGVSANKLKSLIECQI